MTLANGPPLVRMGMRWVANKQTHAKPIKLPYSVGRVSDEPFQPIRVG
jgi:hypothetical protein